MKSIDEYIALTEEKENISDGGAPAYRFDEDGVVLIRYTTIKKYCPDARENEELIAAAANKKRKNGVRTPYHYAIKREDLGDEIAVCWVLQECAKGKCFSAYSASVNAPRKQLEMQKKLMLAPDSHYDKCVKDLCELSNMGIELKPKNIFYDDDPEKGGFTFIDLLDYDDKPLNSESLKDIVTLVENLGCIIGQTKISKYDEKANQEEIALSRELSEAINAKVFMAMKRNIPNFADKEKWVLRMYPENVLSFFKEQHIFDGNLAMSEKEYALFDKTMNDIVGDCIEKLASGKYELWQIYFNELRIALEQNGMYYNWLYHRDNKEDKAAYDDDYDYMRACREDLTESAKNMFNERIMGLSSNNEYLNKAKETIEESLTEQTLKNN